LADQSRPLQRAFSPPGYLKVSFLLRSTPRRRKCLIVEVGKNLPEGLVTARQQNRREHVETIRTMLTHVPASALFDKGHRYRKVDEPAAVLKDH